jgi:hypothetical protein
VYGHIIPEVRKGQRVEAGQRIARINPDQNTNGGVAPHLHFEVHRYVWVPPGTDRLDPAGWLKNATYVGETPDPAAPAPAPKPSGGTAMQEIDQTGKSPNTSSRNGARVRLFVLHTQEGPGTAQSLANYLQNAASEVSYHYSIDNQTCIDVVDTDRSSWSVLDANPYCINLCFAGSRASQSRQVWLDQYGAAIDYAAKLFVQDARKYGLGTRTLSWDEIGRGLSGGTDHYGITKGLFIGSHTDCGPNFPWDVFQAAIARHANGAPAPAPAPVPNAIDLQYKASPWLGAKLTAAVELSTPDGRGRFAEYENGHIYWTAETGARPIPKRLFEVFAELGFEGGALGYPVAFHTVLPAGDVQAFERGVLYRKYDQPGYCVTGAIGDRWMRSGFENGPFGWPTSNEQPTEDGIGRVQQFEHGRIVWYPDGTVALQPVDGPDLIIPDRH